jgi:phosphatidylglycerophosphatase A
MPAWLTRCLATGLYTGYSPTVPGTVGTVPALILVWFCFGCGVVWPIAITIVMTLASIWLAGEAELLLGHDSKKIVIDEWAGMCVSVLFIPHTIGAYLVAFAAFRLFDVIKLPPAAQFEKLPRGWGVTMDDVAAGVQANIATWIIVLLVGKPLAM